MRAVAVIMLILIWAPLSAYAQTERRLALVLANEDYPPEIGRLTNTHEDAAKIEAALQDIGFTVTKVLDADADGLESAITDFEIAIDREAADGSKVVAFVYTSMHGASADVGGRTRNFLIPAREQIASPGQLFRKGVRVDQLIAGLGATDADAVFVVSDACRNSLGTSFTKSTTKGFVPVNAGPGILVAYATAPGATTPDDGLFADLLARELRVSGRKASFAMFSAVEAVSRARPFDGQPFISPGGLPDWLCFNGCSNGTESPALEASAALKALNSGDVSELRAFLQRFPSSDNRRLVEREIAVLESASGSAAEDGQDRPISVGPKTPAPRQNEAWEQYAGLVIPGCEETARQKPDVCMINKLAWSPNGAMIAAATSDGMIRIFDNVTGQELSNWSSGFDIAATDIAWGPDSKQIAVTSLWNDSVRVFDARRAFEIARLTLPGAGPLSWDAKSRQLLVAHSDGISIVTFEGDQVSTTILVEGDHGIEDVRDIDFEKDLVLIAGETESEPHAAFIEIGGMEGFTDLVFPAAPEARFASRHVSSVAISPDRGKAAIGMFNGWAFVFDLASRGPELVLIEGETSVDDTASAINAIDWSPDGQRILVTDEDPRIRLFDAVTGVLLSTLETNQFNADDAAFNPSGDRIAVASIDGTLRLWRLLEP